MQNFKFWHSEHLTKLRIKEFFSCLEEPVYRYEGRRKSVFAEAYDPEDDEGKDDVKVKINLLKNFELFLYRF
jgi:hypothetical protein